MFLKNKIPVIIAIIQVVSFLLLYIFNTTPYTHAIISWEEFLFIASNILLFLTFLILFLIKEKENMIIWMTPFLLIIIFYFFGSKVLY